MREELTLAEFSPSTEKRHGTKKLSRRDDQQRFRDYLLPALGKRKLSAIDRAMVARMLSDADKAGKSADCPSDSGAGIEHALQSRGGGYLDANPAQSVKVSGSTVKRDRFLQPDELARFFEAVVAEPNETIRDLIRWRC